MVNGFARIPDQVLKDNTLSLAAVRLYAHYARHLWKPKDVCFHSDAEIAKDTGLGIRTISRVRQTLVASGHILYQLRAFAEGGRRVLVRLLSAVSPNANKDSPNAKKDESLTTNDQEPRRERQIPPPIPARGRFSPPKKGGLSAGSSAPGSGERSALEVVKLRFGLV